MLAADGGYAGPRRGCRAGCGSEHEAEFVSWREKKVDTVLGLVAIRRDWYHCAACVHGFTPRDQQLGVAGQTTSPGLRKMIARAAAAVPFAAAARLISEQASPSPASAPGGAPRPMAPQPPP